MRLLVASWLALASACGQASPAASDGSPGDGVAAADDRSGRPAVADLATAEGDVRWQGAAAGAWTPAHQGLGLRSRDSVQTMDGATAAVQFRKSGALVRIGPRTTLRIPDQEPTVARLRHLSGRLVARLPGGSVQRLEVELPPGTLVLGGATGGVSPPAESVEARVEVDEGLTQIAMLDGAARLERAHGDDVAVREDHFVELRTDGQVTRSGRLGAMAVLGTPVDGATIRTRNETRFAWSPIPGAAAARLIVQAEGGAPTSFEVPTDRTALAVELASGVYHWTVAGVIDGEEMPSPTTRTVRVELDRIAPSLEIASPTPGANVRGNMVHVAGRTEPGAKLSVQGREVEVAGNGTFSASVAVPRGLTNIVVATADDLGNTRVSSRSVLRE